MDYSVCTLKFELYQVATQHCELSIVASLAAFLLVGKRMIPFIEVCPLSLLEPFVLHFTKVYPEEAAQHAFTHAQLGVRNALFPSRELYEQQQERNKGPGVASPLGPLGKPSKPLKTCVGCGKCAAATSTCAEKSKRGRMMGLHSRRLSHGLNGPVP